MTGTQHASHQDRNDWKSEVRRELDRGMEREMQLRAILRQERIYALDHHVDRSATARLPPKE